MTRRNYVLLATLGSVGLLLGAFAFQHIGGMAPCKMCIWQRYPHAVAILGGALALAMRKTAFIVLGALASFVTGCIGVYHAGVEQGWWEGPTTCTSGPIGNLSADELLDQIMAAPLVRCDDIPWEMLGLSMAGWNAFVSFCLCALWIMALRRA